MQLLYPSASAYATVMSDVAAFTGAATVGLMLVSKFFFQVGSTRKTCACLCHFLGITGAATVGLTLASILLCISR